MNRKFSEVLEDYLEERDRQNGDYYDRRYFGERRHGFEQLLALRKELDEMVHGVKK